jgi:transcriptional regulator with PAS, ATPase and Fis domain
MRRTGNNDACGALVRLSPEIVSGLLDNRYEGITIVDRDGLILYMSRSTERYFDLEPGAGIGKHVTEVFPGSRLHMVAKTGRAEIGAIVEAKGKRKIVSRIPIFKDKEIVGAVSKIMFRDIRTLMQVSVQIQLVDKPPFNDPQRSRQVEGVRYTIEDVLGVSPQAIALRDFIRMASKTSSNVLIIGETGSGKEVAAQAIHHLSARNSGPFVSVNCSSIPQNLFESELFGYAPGAFTGAAKKGKIGIIPLAQKGTLFLDEVSELPLEMQPKLPRVLEEKALYPLVS